MNTRESPCKIPFCWGKCDASTISHTLNKEVSRSLQENAFGWRKTSHLMLVKRSLLLHSHWPILSKSYFYPHVFSHSLTYIQETYFSKNCSHPNVLSFGLHCSAIMKVFSFGFHVRPNSIFCVSLTVLIMRHPVHWFVCGSRVVLLMMPLLRYGELRLAAWLIRAKKERNSCYSKVFLREYQCVRTNWIGKKRCPARQWR